MTEMDQHMPDFESNDSIEANDAVEAEISASLNDSIQTIDDIMAQFLVAADVNAVYGEPQEFAQNLIIPAAEVLSVAGFGLGSGYGSSAAQDTGSGGGGGGGGGGRVLARPVAVIVVSPDGVHVKPVVDVTKIALAYLTALGFIVATFLRMRRGKISDE